MRSSALFLLLLPAFVQAVNWRNCATSEGSRAATAVAVDADHKNGVVRATFSMAGGMSMASIATGSVLAGNSSRREPLHPASIDSFRFLDQKNSSFEMSLKLPVELQGADL